MTAGSYVVMAVETMIEPMFEQNAELLESGAEILERRVTHRQ
jgi:hypothetical protein